jgi:hypothetical protein
MGVTSTQGFTFKLVANGTDLDLFASEEILVSDNVTGLFDLGVLPADFTRQITVPGTKKNNAFFEHVYDISIVNPFLFATNQKVPCYLDFDGIYLASGYLQLNRVNVIANKFIDSYEITVYGGLSSFARDINRYYLTDLTSSLSVYNHTSSIENITASWEGNLFNGDIVYPFAEYGQQIRYTPEEAFFGIDSPEGALSVQDYKPSIRIKKVWDAIFNEYGYTYVGEFWEQPWLDNVYLVCNNQLRYPVYDTINLENNGLFKIGPISGSGQTNITMTAGNELQLPWFNILENPSNSITSNLDYTLDFPSKLRGELNLNFELRSTGTGNSVPAFNLKVRDAVTNALVSTTSLVNYNQYMEQIYTYNDPQTKTQQFELLTEFNTDLIPVGTYNFFLEYGNAYIPGLFQIILDPGNTTKSFLKINKVNQGGDGLVMDIASNMPFGTTGIKQIDFITSLQKKFNLIIYPNKTKPREFIVETFNSWYKKGEIKDFNKYINLDKKLEVIPANNLAVNQLNFGDTLDGDYVSQQFSKEFNREFGKSYYTDTENFFSQGTFEVKTKMASSPLIYLTGTGLSGSISQKNATFKSSATASVVTNEFAVASSYIKHFTTTIVTSTAFARRDIPGISSDTNVKNVVIGDTIEFNANGNVPGTYQFNKRTDSGLTLLGSGTSPATLLYSVTDTDVASGVLEYIVSSNVIN